MRAAAILMFALMGTGSGVAQDAALPQETAAVDPAAPLATLGASDVVTQCQLVAADDNDEVSGACLSSTQTFLDGLQGEPTETDAQIVDLVVELVPLVQDDVCNSADEEIAQAVRLASERVTDPEQAARLVDIADTVASCEQTETAAIVADAVPASAA